MDVFISSASSVWSPEKAEECKARQRWHHTALNGKKPRSALSLGFVLIAFRMHTHDALLISKVCVFVCIWVHAFNSFNYAFLLNTCRIFKHALAYIYIYPSSLDGYCSTDQSDRVGDGPCHMIERETFQVILHSWYGNKTLSATIRLGPDSRSIFMFKS